ncbi:N-acetylglucosamine-6-phosphate deacetylase [Marinibacterium profundimaris]|uniref:N-acetylglucosamine-6-phosphate deacetylase n=1 Tax=Marinibacterium profundimaris TaxID=1679460 RepID=A0A225NS01_9RHOB|nr:N-acetylglucosamine-6-phosphate deacetylase [Marinibacterium profundimaris]OWU77724.1 N-acetylglucosamine-6-phosphate deacetylase [Marinibacterium profundimaris]
MTRSYHGGRIFDGTQLHDGATLRLEDDLIAGISTAPPPATSTDLGGDILCPGYVDLQVNGGDGVMLGDAVSVGGLRRIAGAHRRLGATTILPTLITDRPEATRGAIAAVTDAVQQGTPGIGGLHLEGPHLSLPRKGAHDAALIREMTAEDLALLCDAARTLPVLLITLAPESTTPDQVAALTRAGALVSLGHTDADYETCLAWHRAGARGVTHLFNAMSQLGSRAPGLVGATLHCPGLTAGLIADGVHVHPATIRAALAAKAGTDGIFLVSDAMAVAGTDLADFTLGGRMIHRAGGRLELENGTLAGADLDLTRAVTVLVRDCGVPLDRALAMATRVPAEFAGIGGAGRLDPGSTAPILRLRETPEGLRLIEVIDPAG